MPSGERTRPNWVSVLAGIQAGVIGALILLGYVALDSAWHRRSVWTVPNLLASTFYGESAYRPGLGARTSAGVALLLVLYGVLGAVFGLVVRDQDSRLRVMLLGLIYGTGWFFLSFDVLWKYVNPLVNIYSPDRAMLVGHLLYGGTLGRRFPAYLRAIGEETIPQTSPPDPAEGSR
jgi:hypothetical protein